MIFNKVQIRRKWLYIALIFPVIYVLEYLGLFAHLAEQNYSTFQYPLVGDVKSYAQQVRRNELPTVKPINVYNHSFISTAQSKCLSNDQIRLVYLIKSAVKNKEQRSAIRRSWGFEQRFSDVEVRTVFILGIVKDSTLMAAVNREQRLHNDIVQLDFEDNYFNNTVKTMNAMRWALQYCASASFYFFSDDDMYISTKNLLRFLRHPTEYPQYLEGPSNILKGDPKTWISNIYNLELQPRVVLYAGYVKNASPLRNKNSKWYITLEEYPYDSWPPYVPAGCYVLSNEALNLLYYTSMYTKHFRFDDIYLSIVALKASIEPFHSDEFYVYSKPDSYKYAIAVHGIKSPEEMVNTWIKQKAAGNA